MDTQLKRLKKVHRGVFIFVNEPGPQFIFSGLSGYTDTTARTESIKRFLEDGRIIAWGIVPTGVEAFSREIPQVRPILPGSL